MTGAIGIKVDGVRLELTPVQIAGFHSRVRKTETCWLWTGGTAKGYGRLLIGPLKPKRVYVSAHRVSYRLHYCRDPEELDVCHTCDVRNCVNPAHFFLGTRADNNRDAQAKGRNGFAIGEKSSNAKLTAEKVREIREAYAKGETGTSIAKRYGMGSSTIYCVLLKQTWGHVE